MRINIPPHLSHFLETHTQKGVGGKRKEHITPLMWKEAGGVTCWASPLSPLLPPRLREGTPVMSLPPLSLWKGRPFTCSSFYMVLGWTWHGMAFKANNHQSYLSIPQTACLAWRKLQKTPGNNSHPSCCSACVMSDTTTQTQLLAACCLCYHPLPL